MGVRVFPFELEYFVMSSRLGRLVAPTTLLIALFGIAGAAPAYAADYTIDCGQTQGAPYTDYDADPAIFYGVYEYDYDGTQTQTITVNILNCGYHFVRHPAGTIVEGYMGQSADGTYTITLPVDGLADAWGYNTWDSPQQTTFIINMYNPAPTDDGGGGGGGGGGSNPETLPQTGFDTVSGIVLGGLALALGLALSVIRRIRRRA
jgi:LPXTG-motif cell wall-anchored protein